MWHPDTPPEYPDQLIVGDALAYLRRWPAGSVPLFLFSPPYNLNRRADSSDTPPGITRSVRLRKLAHSRDDAPYAARGGNGKWRNGTAYDGTTDDMPHTAYVAWQQSILQSCWDALADDGAIYYVHKPRIRDGICVTPLDYNPGLPLRQIVVNDRGSGVNMAPTHYMPTCEWICVFAKMDFRLRDKRASGAGDVWNYPPETYTWHPAPFPLALALEVLATTRPRAVVDPFVGSGTTAKAARLLGIPFSGNDKSRSYVERARRELARPNTTGRRQGDDTIELPLFTQELTL